MSRTLLLDLDGTLVDSVPDLLASCNRIMAARGLAPFAMPEVTAMVGDGAPALVRKIMEARGRVATPKDLEDLLADYIAHGAALTRPYPGALDAMDRLAADGWRLAICTNKPVSAARALLSELGLLPRFAAIGGGDSYPARKPDPSHLLATLAAAGGTPDQAVMLGDHHNDVAAASAAGIPCIFAAWGYGPLAMAAAAAVAHAFEQVPALAGSLLTTSPPDTSSPPRTTAS